MTLENWMKIEGARGKNVRSSIFFNFLVKTLGANLGPKKWILMIPKAKMGIAQWILPVSGVKIKI